MAKIILNPAPKAAASEAENPVEVVYRSQMNLQILRIPSWAHLGTILIRKMLESQQGFLCFFEFASSQSTPNLGAQNTTISSVSGIDAGSRSETGARSVLAVSGDASAAVSTRTAPGAQIEKASGAEPADTVPTEASVGIAASPVEQQPPQPKRSYVNFLLSVYFGLLIPVCYFHWMPNILHPIGNEALLIAMGEHAVAVTLVLLLLSKIFTGLIEKCRQRALTRYRLLPLLLTVLLIAFSYSALTYHQHTSLPEWLSHYYRDICIADRMQPEKLAYIHTDQQDSYRELVTRNCQRMGKQKMLDYFKRNSTQRLERAYR